MLRRLVAALLAACACILLLTSALIDMVSGRYTWGPNDPELEFMYEAGSALGLIRAAKLHSSCTDAQEKQIWDALLELTGNPYSAAGIMGNLYAESGLSSTNMENSYEVSLGFTDATYTAAVDSGTYTNFVHDSVGYGIAQFTYWSLKRDVYNYARDNGLSVGDLTGQLQVLKNQVQSRTSLLSSLQNAESVREASDIFLHDYERPENQSVEVEALRASYGQYFYEKYEFGFSGSTEKTNLGLAQWAVAAYDQGWGYVWGTYGHLLTQSYYEAKLAQYPDGVGRYADFILDNWLGKRTADCIGLIKGYSWYDAETGKIGYAINGMPDIGADQIYNLASEKGPISTLPEIPGLILWSPGHVGIYIGNGYAIEARGTMYGVVKTKVSERSWVGWCKNPYIAYISDAD